MNIEQAQQAWADAAAELSRLSEICAAARREVQRANTEESNAKTREAAKWADLVKLRNTINRDPVPKSSA